MGYPSYPDPVNEEAEVNVHDMASKIDEIHAFIGELKGMLDGLASNPMLAAFLKKG